jgi:hypothetical protein
MSTSLTAAAASKEESVRSGSLSLALPFCPRSARIWVVILWYEALISVRLGRAFLSSFLASQSLTWKPNRQISYWAASFCNVSAFLKSVLALLSLFERIVLSSSVDGMLSAARISHWGSSNSFNLLTAEKLGKEVLVMNCLPLFTSACV